MSVLKRRSFVDIVNYSPVYAAAVKAAQEVVDAGGDPEEVLEDLAMVMGAVAHAHRLGIEQAARVLSRLCQVEYEATTYLDGAAEA